MQGNRRNGDPFFDFGDPFAGFGALGGGFGGQRSSLMSNFFNGRDPFDDPFFQRPFGSMFGPGMFNPMGNPFNGGPTPGLLDRGMPQPTHLREPIIEELKSDDDEEKEDEEKRDNPRKHARSSNGPYVEDPDEAIEGRRSKQLQYMNNLNRLSNTHSQPNSHSYTFHSSSVTYGGVDGAYYTSSRTRRTGSDGLTFEEAKEADTTRGQASHRISRGIHDKGHTVDRKLKSDGRVDMMQTLHNLEEDELSGFNKAWNGNASKHLPGWNQGLDVNGGMGQMGAAGVRGQHALPSTEPIQNPGNTRLTIHEPRQPSRRSKSGLGDGTTFSGGNGGTPYKDHTNKH